MREGWKRAKPALELTLEQLQELTHPAFPGSKVLESNPTEGGLANTNLRIRLSSFDNPVLLRIFERDPAQARKENQLYSLIKGKVPSAQALYFSSSNPITQHPYMIMEWVEGQRLEVVAPKVSSREIIELGRSLGATLAAIHDITFEHTGFFDENLDIPVALDMGGPGLVDFTRRCLLDDVAARRLGPQLAAALLKFVEEEAHLLDQWLGPPCLTHSDFGGSNILVRQMDQGWSVVAVLDWEFAFSGTPFFDFGNLLRQPLGCLDQFEDSVISGYKESGMKPPQSWRKMSLLTDLTAWLEFLTRPAAGPELVSDARSVISDTIERCK